MLDIIILMEIKCKNSPQQAYGSENTYNKTKSNTNNKAPHTDILE